MRRLAVAVAFALLSGCPACFEYKLNQQGRPYPCDPDAGEDPVDGGNRPDGGAPQCGPSWRCGLERVCHPRGDAGIGTWLCVDDSWCEGGWECGPEGRCGPHIDDGLRADGGGPVTVEWVSPYELDRLPDTISVAPDEPVAPGFHGSAAAYTLGDRFALLGRARLGPDTDPITGQYQSYFFTATLLSPNVKEIVSSATASPGPLVLSDIGVGYVFTDFLDAGPGAHVSPYQHPWPTVRGEHLRLVPSPVPYAAVFGNGAELTGLEFPRTFSPSDAGPFTDFRSQPWPLGNLPVMLPDGGFLLRAGQQVADFTAVSTGERELALISCDGQLLGAERFVRDGGSGAPVVAYWQSFADPRDGGFPVHQDSTAPVWMGATLLPAEGAFAPLSFDLSKGYAYLDAGSFTVRRMRAAGDRVALEADFGNRDTRLLLGSINYNAPRPGAEPYPFVLLAMPPCNVCPPWLGLHDFRPVGQGEPLMEARCADAGIELTVTLHLAVGDFRCTAEAVGSGPGPFGDHYVPSLGLVGHGGWVGAHGQLWEGESIADTRAVVLDRPPQVLVSDRDEVAAVDHRVFYFHNPDFGFLASSGLPQQPEAVPIASVIGNSEWIVTQAMNIGRRTRPAENIGANVLERGPSVDVALLHEPYLASIARAGDGGVVLIASSNDGVFSGDATRQLLDARERPGTIEFRLVPSIRVPVRALAAVDAVPGLDGGAPYAHAWLLAGSELFELIAETAEHWRARRVEIPDGVTVKVVGDGPWGRLGYSDGRVLSLPQLKPLAGPLTAPLEDLYVFNGQLWGLTAGGTWHLEAPNDGGVTGEWVKGPDVVRDGGFEYGGARFYEAARKLYVINRFGHAFSMKP